MIGALTVRVRHTIDVIPTCWGCARPVDRVVEIPRYTVNGSIFYETSTTITPMALCQECLSEALAALDER